MSFESRYVEVANGILAPEQDLPIVSADIGDGCVTLIFSGNLFALSPEDRAFVFSLVDAISGHTHVLPETSSPEPLIIEANAVAIPTSEAAVVEEGMFACPDCEFVYGTKQQLGVHRSHVHIGRAPLTLDDLKCLDCGQVCRGQMGLASHRRSKHGVSMQNGVRRHDLDGAAQAEGGTMTPRTAQALNQMGGR